MRVTGIGGLFFRCSDPDATAQWYHEHFGINPVPTEAGQEPWRQDAGPTVFAPFPNDADYFPSEKSWMINFRVDDLDEIVARLRGDGISVEVSPEDPTGKFARLYDPEGNPIELWQPAP